MPSNFHECSRSPRRGETAGAVDRQIWRGGALTGLLVASPAAFGSGDDASGDSRAEEVTEARTGFFFRGGVGPAWGCLASFSLEAASLRASLSAAESVERVV